MKIAVFEPHFLTPKSNSSSYLVALQNQVRGLTKAGNEVTVLAEGNNSIHPTILPEGTRVYQLRGLLSFGSSYFSVNNRYAPFLCNFSSPEIIFNAARLLKRELKPDVIYSSGTSFSGVRTALLGYLSGIPTVHYIFQYTSSWKWWKGDTEVMKGYRVPTTYLIKQFFNTAIHELPRRQFLQERSLRSITRIITSSNYVRGHLHNLGLDTEKVSVIYPPVDLTPLPNYTDDKSAPLVTYLGHFWQGRGVLDLLEAFWRVKTDHPEARLVIAPTNVQELTERAASELINRYNLQPYIKWKGIVEDVYLELLGPATCIVLPYHDTPSMKLLESMAAARPVITTRIDWTPELIQDGENGFLVEVGDKEAIAERVKILIEDPALAEKMGKRARETINARCSPGKNTLALMNILREARDAHQK